MQLRAALAPTRALRRSLQIRDRRRCIPGLSGGHLKLKSLGVRVHCRMNSQFVVRGDKTKGHQTAEISPHR